MPDPALVLTSVVVVTAFLLGGCSAPGIDAPDAVLPGVRTESIVHDDFRCGELLFAQGCVIVRIERVESGCAPEVGAYVLCNATIEWSATSGAVEPGSHLITEAGGVDGPTCDPMPGDPCRVTGSVNRSHRFTGPGEEDLWPIVFTAGLETPSSLAGTSGEFTLSLEMRVRTEEADALTS
ncbi:MAG TPA: hypothetical protein VM327_01945 [Candidatus Thermoplasmatota archaeon]|nr:hypothetical protein [Candidatus Thermoplasmatota archaeon]